MGVISAIRSCGIWTLGALGFCCWPLKRVYAKCPEREPCTEMSDDAFSKYIFLLTTVTIVFGWIQLGTEIGNPKEPVTQKSLRISLIFATIGFAIAMLAHTAYEVSRFRLLWNRSTIARGTSYRDAIWTSAPWAIINAVVLVAWIWNLALWPPSPRPMWFFMSVVMSVWSAMLWWDLWKTYKAREALKARRTAGTTCDAIPLTDMGNRVRPRHGAEVDLRRHSV
ncbi:hypothetical protein K458DRAFT_391915 [Lentithecium fluviatile CBS 122367]|uniref:Uncharacterized protein n=1 Tax=Lentithecium fluviatile CBS 122367 TaxID=1168545 RepID=A0A6G1IUB0_9PLEO|nr:hypothetical protein K458DRAFT_391915 [Lentithecium fluviatile CBS 122367]